MTSLPCPPTAPDPADGRSRLAALASAISHPDLAPQAVGAAFRDDQVELHVKDLAGDHPVDQLLGFRAPDEWDAFGLTVTGRTVPYPDGDTERAGPEPAHGPLLVTFLAGRDGSSAALLLPDGHEPLLIDEPEGSEAEGAIADLCWRVLGRPTAAPQLTVAQYWTTWWLDRIVSLVAGEPRWTPTWEALTLLHPATRALVRADDDPLLAMGAGIRQLTEALSKATSWHRLRTEPDDVHLWPPNATPDLVAWMDDGIFSRWAMAQLPDPRDLLDTVAELLPSQLVHLIEQVARDAGLRSRAPRSDRPSAASSSG